MTERRSVAGGLITWFFGPRGAHVRVPGFMYMRNTGEDYGFSIGRSWSVLGLVALRHNDTKSGALKHCKPAGWSIKFATVDLQKIKRAFRRADTYVS